MLSSLGFPFTGENAALRRFRALRSERTSLHADRLLRMPGINALLYRFS